MGRSISNFFKNNIEYLSIIFVIAFAVLFQLFKLSVRIENKILINNTIDYSWSLDISERFLHGYMAGRDFIFTYGPLYQLINSVYSYIFHIPSFSSILLGTITLQLICYILFFIITTLLTNSKKYRLLLTSILIFSFGLWDVVDADTLIRILVPLFYSLIYYKFIYKHKNKNLINFKNILILSLPSVFGLYIFELYISCFLITVFFIVFNGFKNVYITKKLSFYQFLYLSISQITILIFSGVLFSFLISNNLSYLTNSIQILSDYKYIMNIPFSKNLHYILLVFPIILILLLSLNKRVDRIRINSEILVLSFASLFALRSALIRTDEAHLIDATLPSLIALFIIIFFNLDLKLKKIFLLFVLFISVLINFNYLNPRSIFAIGNLRLALNNNADFFSIHELPRDFYSIADLTEFSKLIEANPRNVFIFPYNNFILNINGTTYNSFVVQFNDFSNSEIENLSVQKLNENPPKFIIYEIDKKAVVPIDNIPTLSRHPIFTKWLIDNYSVKSKSESYLVLEKSNKFYRSMLKGCEFYELDISTFTKTSFLENIIKPTTYYLNSDNYLRLPYTKNSDKFLIFENYSDANSLERLFNSRLKFGHGLTQSNKNLKVIKKYFIPGVSKTYSDGYRVDCKS